MKENIVKYFDEVAARALKTATVDMNGLRKTSYKELLALSRAVTGALIDAGVKGIVPVLMPRGRDYIAAVLGALRAGLAVAPLDMAYPKERTDAIAEDCASEFIIDEAFFERAKTHAEVNDYYESADSRALIFFTSGSTGKPKGVIHSHESVVTAFKTMSKAFKVSSEDIYASSASFSFVAFMMDVLLQLLNGATVHILSDECRKDIGLMSEYYQEHGITCGFMSPQMLKRYKNAAPSLRYMLTGSERVSNIAPKGYTLYNVYAMSESGMCISVYEVTSAKENTPIGKSTGKVNIYLVNDDGEEANEGEICITGSIFSGYLNRDDLTAQALTPNPFKDRDGCDKLFHTGDIARKDENGDLIYMNRRDFMVKINGQRVEPGEIEAVINKLGIVNQAAVKGFVNEYGQTYLCAYYVGEREIAQSEFKALLSKKLASYMIPQFFIKLDAFPLNRNGKLDMLKLAPPDASDYRAAYAPPTDDKEKALCSAFESVLKLDKVGIDDDFFMLGGDSIKAVMLQESLKGFTLSSASVMAGRTPKGIASLMTETEDLFEGLSKKASAPLTDSQLGVYLECAENPDGLMYNVPVIVTFKVQTDIDRLCDAVKKALSTHAAFYAYIAEEDGTPVMRRREETEFSGVIIEAKETELNALKLAFIRPFDLKNGPLFRYEFIKTEENIYLLLDMHHTVSDGATVGVLADEIAAAYSERDISEETIDAFMLAELEEKQAKSEAYKAAHDYYESYIGGIDVNSNIIFDKKPEQGVSDYPAAAIETPLFADGGAKLVERFASGAGITESTVFLGAFAYALAKFSGQDESLFCTVENGRHDARLNSTAGMLVKTIPVYTRLNEEIAATEYLQAVQKRFFSTIANDIYPFTKLSREYGINSDILYVYQAETLNGAHMGDYFAPMDTMDVESALANLNAMVFKRDGEYLLKLTYRSDLYHSSTIRRFANMFALIVSGLCENAKLSDIKLISPADEASYKVVNGTVCEYDRKTTLVSMFREQVKKTPTALAVKYLSVSLTYKELDELTDRLACYIHAQSIGRENVVAVLIPRGEFMPIASLGIIKAGAAYEPLDPSYPPERLNFMVNDANTKLVITTPELRGVLDEYSGPVLMTDDILSLPEARLDFEPPKAEDLFILLYTSGSTGIPKGCMLEQRNLVAFTKWYINRFELNENCAVAAYASYGFDANMMDTYPTLLSGASLHIIPESMRLELEKINDYFIENNVTHSFMTTQVGRQFATSIDAPAPCLKYLLAGGEKLVPFMPKQNYTFINLYGPTECSVCITAFELDGEYDNVPIGINVADSKLYIIDKYSRLMPIGVPGELCAAGLQVSRGYLNQPEKTAAAFSPNPFAQDDEHARIYHTGDVVRLLENGNFEFIGRRDQQVKVRGFRIELTEVERVIRDFPGISDATVIAKDAPAGGKMLLGYIVSNEKIDINALNAFILEQKPPYMVPAAIMQIDKIPLNVNQKVDKRKLPEIKLESTENEGSARPMTRLEKEIFDIVKEIVGHESFTASTLLTMAGVTSLSAIKLAALILKKYNYSISVKELLGNASVLSIEEGLIDYLLSARTEAPQDKPSDDTKAPLTQTQTGIYLECMRLEGSDVYSIPLLYKLNNIDAKKLQKAVRTAIDAHPSLKCRIEQDEAGDIFMQPTPELEYDVPIISIDTDELNAKIASGELVTAFDIAKAPLFASRIFVTADITYLLLESHHIISDGTTLGVLIEDIDAAYRGESIEKEQYTSFDLGRDEAKLRKTDAYKQAKAYYDSVFNGVSIESLPDKDVYGAESCLKTYKLSTSNFIQAAASFCKKNNVTENALFTGAFAYTLARFDGAEEALFTAIYNGRTDVRTMRMAGMLVKTFPVYAAIDLKTPVSTYVLNMREHLNKLMANDLYSFAEVSRAYGISTDILFAYQGDTLSEVKIGGCVAEPVRLELSTLKSTLNIDVYKEADGYRIEFEYDGGRYSEGFIDSFARAYAKAAESMLTSDTLGDVSITPDTAFASLEKFNDTSWPVEDRPAYRLLQDSAHKYPDNIAVIANGEKLTYKELNESTNRVGRALISAGVKVNTLVGVMLYRTKYVYISREGVLKSGGAFLPIDPEYPDDRIEYTLTDSGTKYLITTDDIYSERRELFNKLNVKVLLVEDTAFIGDGSDINVNVGRDDLCYCIYTSGSTGKPKGVLLMQHNLVYFVDGNPKNHEILGYIEKGHVSLALAAITFDVSLMEEFIPLAHGLTICMANKDEIHNPMALKKLMMDNHVDIMSCTPSFLLNILDMEELHEAICNVRSIDFGAEAFTPAIYDKLRAINKDVYIMNGYGPTEATISCTMAVIESNEHITIGIPNSNVKVVMVDEQNRVLPIGALGEMVIMGEGVGRGYIGRDELTREKFITLMGLPAYKSGDLARITAAGEIEFHGRTDNQVKLRGLRVELGEIESTINRYPSIKASIVLVKENESGQFLAGYFTASEEIDKEALTKHLSASLTYYMVPNVLIQMDVFPLTANGKIDKKQLPDAVFTVAAREYIAPANDVEKAFCGAFEKILGIERVGATDDFFELGGTSLSASKVAMFAMTNGYQVVYQDIFDSPTARKLALLCLGDTEAEQDDEHDAQIEDYDYSSLAPALKLNSLENVDTVIGSDVGNIALTGATGFLGIHVLRNYLDSCTGKVYCFMRKGDATSLEARLQTMLMYYFGKHYKELFSERIFLIEGDITDKESLVKLESADFDTLINCAACVKHFAADDTLYRINVAGVENLVELCVKLNKRLIQVSTVSIAGEGKNGMPPEDKRIFENELYFNQSLTNAYIHSKFLAERAVLEAIQERGLDAKIMRVGNLMSRDEDGEFQINYLTNGFMRQLRGYKLIGKFPMGLMDSPAEFSPIDSTAAAILKLSGTNREFTIYHPYNNHLIFMSDVIAAMNKFGYKIDVVKDEVFQAAMMAAMDDSAISDAVSGLIAYLTRDTKDKIYLIESNNKFTTETLYRLGYKWPITSTEYLMNALEVLDGFDFFGLEG